MSDFRCVLVATQDPGIARSVIAWLSPAGVDLTLVTTFEAAKRQLTLKPALVIADVKLGAYNGLQVAARARVLGIASIVIGPPDNVLLRDAIDIGVTYLETELTETPLVETTLRLLGVDGTAGTASTTNGATGTPGTTETDDRGWPLWPESAPTVFTPGSAKRALVH